MGTPLRVLYVEDKEDDARLVLRELKRCGLEVTHKRVETAEAMRAALKEEAWDIIFSDHSMPHFDSFGALAVYRESGLDIPFILITGSVGEERAVEILKAGAHDFILKDKLARLCVAVPRELAEAEGRRARRQAEEGVRRAKEEWERTFEAVPDAICILDTQQRIVRVNRAMSARLGRRPEDCVGLLCYEVVHGLSAPPSFCPHAQLMRDGKEHMAEVSEARLGGDFIVTTSPLRDDEGRLLGSVHVARDITERKHAEEQIRRHAAQTEALNRIAFRLNAQLDFRAVLTAVCEEAAEAMGTPVATVLLHDERQEDLYYAEARGLPSEFLHRGERIPRAVYEGYRTRSCPVTVLPDVASDPHLPNVELLRQYGIRTAASVAMTRDGRLMGCLVVATVGEPRQFTPDELSLLEGIAHQASQAITNARLLGEAKRQLGRLQALREIDMAITASLDLRVTLNVFLEHVTTQLSVQAADVLLLNPHTLTLDYAAGRGFRTRALQQTRLRLGQGHAGKAALERQTVTISRLSEADPVLQQSPLIRDEDFVFYCAAPLMAKGQVQGVLEVFHRGTLVPDRTWTDFLDALAGQAAIAIDNAGLFADLQRTNVELSLAYDTTLEGWSRALDLRDQETEGHTRRVAELTVRLAKTLGLSETEIVHVRRGALLHDIGKMGIPDKVLLKPGKLDDEEWKVMKRHPTYALELLSPIAYLRPALDIPYCHHEKWDGSGYPRGLKGEQIPLSARIFAAVDVWDAMRSDRPYRKAMPEDAVREHIGKGSGTHFDPKVVEAFLAMQF